MNYIVLVLAVMMAFGCISPVSPPAEVPEAPEKVCRTVTETVPSVVEECGEVSYTESECGRRELSYESAKSPLTHFCTLDGDCGGKSLSTCAYCDKAMTRCSIEINNTDNKPGEWVVGATFSIYNAIFTREPLSAMIEPGEGHTFDFQQFYDPGHPINSAKCEIAIQKVPVIEDCREVTRTRVDCVNVTKTTTVEREVCD